MFEVHTYSDQICHEQLQNSSSPLELDSIRSDMAPGHTAIFHSRICWLYTVELFCSCREDKIKGLPLPSQTISPSPAWIRFGFFLRFRLGISSEAGLENKAGAARALEASRCLNSECWMLSKTHLWCFSLIREVAESRSDSFLNSWVVAMFLQYSSWKCNSVWWYFWEGNIVLLTLI